MSEPELPPAEPGLTIRRAHPIDIEAIGRVWHRAWHRSHAVLSALEVVAFRDEGYFLGRAADLSRRAFIAQRDGRVVGFCGWKDEQLDQLFVNAEEEGRTTGARLLAAAEAEMAREGTSRAWLHCRVGNARALRFYEKHGWSRVEPTSEALETAQRPVSVEIWRLEKLLATDRF